jgi:squalene-hopene/tetraprenyl-beta-curcumene cyclase
MAPGYYNATDSALEKRVQALREYLKENPGSQNTFNQTWLLLASTQLKGLVAPAQKQELIDKLKGLQRNDGGWVLLQLGPWKYSQTEPPPERDLSPKTKNSDGYATGLVTFTLLRAAVPKTDPTVRAGLTWLKKNQQPDGSWPGFSINAARAEESLAFRFMSDAATAFAVLALLEAGE